MNALDLRAASTDDLPALTRLLPPWQLDAASFCDGDRNDQLLVVPGAGAARGCIRIRRAIGLLQPRYWFHVGYRVHAAADLGMFRRERTLLLGNDHTGATELCDLAVDESLDAARQAQLTRLLVRAAVLLLHRDHALHSATSESLPRVIAALPGARDELGAAPFWQGLGRHFYPDDVDQALARFGDLWFTHVAALLPRHPLVVSVLHADAQAAIGVAAARAEPLRAALLGAGLRAGQHVDLRDGGPVFEAHLDLVGASSMRRMRLQVGDAIGPTQVVLLAAEQGTRLRQVRAHFGAAGQLQIATNDAQACGVSDGDPVWVDLDGH